jgi:hypothetical protein
MKKPKKKKKLGIYEYNILKKRIKIFLFIL